MLVAEQDVGINDRRHGLAHPRVGFFRNDPPVKKRPVFLADRFYQLIVGNEFHLDPRSTAKIHHRRGRNSSRPKEGINLSVFDCPRGFGHAHEMRDVHKIINSSPYGDSLI